MIVYHISTDTILVLYGHPKGVMMIAYRSGTHSPNR